MFVWQPTERRECLNVTHSGFFLFECHTQKVHFVWVLPQKVAFVARLPTELFKSYRITQFNYRKMLLFLCYPQKSVLSLSCTPWQKSVVVWVYPQKRISLEIYRQKSGKGLGLPMYEMKPFSYVSFVETPQETHSSKSWRYSFSIPADRICSTWLTIAGSLFDESARNSIERWRIEKFHKSCTERFLAFCNLSWSTDGNKP